MRDLRAEFAVRRCALKFRSDLLAGKREAVDLAKLMRWVQRTAGLAVGVPTDDHELFRVLSALEAKYNVYRKVKELLDGPEEGTTGAGEAPAGRSGDHDVP